MQDSVASNHCEYCNKTFKQSKSFLTHLCEPKRRWMDRDSQTNRTAYNAWRYYFAKHHPSMSIDYKDFTKNSFYLSFMKFATYCLNTKVIHIIFFIDFLLSHKVPIDKWCNDTHYAKFLSHYLKSENVNDAVKRTIRTLENMCEEENIEVKDSFKYLNGNRLCQKIYQGLISPWVLYTSDSAMNFLHNLNEDQVRIVYPVIDPDIWRIKIFREKDNSSQVKQILKNYVL